MALNIGELVAYINVDSSRANSSVSSFTRNMQSSASTAASRFQAVGQSITGVGKNIYGVGAQLTKGITAPVGGAVLAVAGLTAALGWGRLKSVDTAQAQLRGLGYDTADVERISGQLTKALEGGMLTMGEATSAAAAGMAAGVSEGKELTRYIKVLDGAVAGSNGTFDEMNQIFARVQGSGKLMTNELQMIEQRMPGFTATMADSFGVTQEKMQEMVSNGEVSAADFMDVMEDFAGDMATEYAKSWEGMVQNTKAYIGIIGEALLSGVFEQSKESIAEFLEFLSSDQVQTWAAETGVAIGNAFAQVLAAVRSVIEWWMNLDGSIQRVILAFAGIVVAIGPVLMIIGKVVMVIGSLVGAAGTVIGALGKLAPIFGALSKVISIVTVALRGLFVAMLANPIGIIIAAVAALVAGLAYFFTQTEAGKQAWASFMEAMQPVTDALQELGAVIMEMVGQILPPLMEAGMQIVQAFMPVVELIMTQLVPVFMELIGTLVAQLVPVIVQLVTAVLPPLIAIISAVVPVIAMLVQAFIPLVEMIIAQVIPIIEALLSVVVTVFEALAPIITAALGIVVGVITTVLGVLTGDWSMAWNGIKQIFSSTWDLIVSVVQGAIKIVQAVILAALKILQATWGTAWNAMKAVLTAVWNGIKSVTTAAVNSIKSGVTQAWNNVRNLTSSVWNAISSAVSNAWNGMRNATQSAGNAVRNAVSSAWNTVRSLTSSAWSAVSSTVRNGVSNVVNNVRSIIGRIRAVFSNIGSLLVSSGRNLLAGFTRGIRDGISRAVDAVRNGVKRIRNFFPSSPAKEGPLSGKGYTTFSGEKMITDFASGMESAEADVVRQAEAITRAAAFDVPSLPGFTGPDLRGPQGQYERSEGAPAGGVTNNFTIVNPQAEPTSESARKASAYIGVSV